MKMESNFNPNRPYCRTEIDEAFKKRKTSMQIEALQRGLKFDGMNLAIYQDCYTGKTLRGGDRYDYEHIISAEAVFSHHKGNYSNEQIADIVNHPDNVAVTLRTINQYKGKYDLQSRILNNPSKISQFDIDVTLAKNNLSKAEKAIFGI